MEKKKLMILGASDFQLPAILKAKEMGLIVGVVDIDKNAVGIPYADKYFCVSTIDEKGVYEATKKFDADGIVTLCTDMPVRALAYTCEKMGLKGIDYQAALCSTDKGLMLNAFERERVAHPKYLIFSASDSIEKLIDDAESKIGYPMITKPTDNSGSRGIMLVKNRSQLVNAVEYSSSNGRTGNIVVEEYMRGPEFSIEIIVLDGTVHVLQVTDKLTNGSPHFVEIGHSQPTRMAEKTEKEVKDLAARAALAVGIKNGAAHAEIIVTNEGPKLVEIGARMGGGCITTHLVPFSTGIDMTKVMIQVAIGDTPDLQRRFNKGAAIRFIEPREGTVTSIEGREKAARVPGIKVIEIQCRVGQQLKKLENGTGRIGYVISQGETVEEAIKSCERAISYIKVNVEQ